MTKVVLDSTVLTKLSSDSEVQICDETGQVVGYFHPAVRYAKRVNGKLVSPFSDAEIKLRSQQRTGRPLKEILDELRQL